jgi:hypothetical protein
MDHEVEIWHILISVQIKVRYNWLRRRDSGDGDAGESPRASGVCDRRGAGRGLVVAVDLPSRRDADTREICGICIRATQTVTFAAAKHGLAGREECTW